MVGIPAAPGYLAPLVAPRDGTAPAKNQTAGIRAAADCLALVAAADFLALAVAAQSATRPGVSRRAGSQAVTHCRSAAAAAPSDTGAPSLHHCRQACSQADGKHPVPPDLQVAVAELPAWAGEPDGSRAPPAATAAAAGTDWEPAERCCSAGRQMA